MNKRILLVDDDYDIISAYKRNLRKDFIVKVATSGYEALQILKEEDEFAAIVTDYKMQKMNGIELLENVWKINPDTIRIIITGHADLQTAIDSVNKGNIFRFLTKPIPSLEFINILKEAIEIFRLKKSEKELLNDTFKGVINVFIDLMQQVHPEAFNHIRRIRALGRDIADDLAYVSDWEYEISLLLSKIGFIMIPPDIVAKYFSSEKLDENDNKMLSPYPELGFTILNKIPRLENISKIIKYQNINYDGSNSGEDQISSENLPFASRVLKAVNDFDKYNLLLNDNQESLFKLQENSKHYDPKILASLSFVAINKKTQNPVVSIGFRELKIGMILIRDVKDIKGNLLLSKGTELTDMLLMRLYHASKVREIQEPLLVIEPYKKH